MKEQPAGKIAVLLEKINNFWSYHKWILLITLFLSGLAIYGVYMISAQKDSALSGVFINCSAQAESTLSEQFAEYAQIDLCSYDVRLDDGIFLSMDYTPTSMGALQSLLVRIHAGELDLLAADTDFFLRCANNVSGILADLREYLDEENLSQLEGQIFYVDRDYLKELEDTMSDGDTYVELQYPNPLYPERMNDPVPVGIDVSGAERIQQVYGISERPLYMGIVSNTEHPETVRLFLEFLLN